MRLTRAAHRPLRSISCHRIGAGTCDLCGPGSRQIFRVELGIEPHRRVVQICDRCAVDSVTCTSANAAGLSGRGTCTVCAESMDPISYVAHAKNGRKIIAETWSSKVARLVQVCPPCVDDLARLLRTPDLLLGATERIDWQKPARGLP